MQTHGQTDMTKLIVAFRNFPKVPKIEIIGGGGGVSEMSTALELP
jgi:hypothetical protein